MPRFVAPRSGKKKTKTPSKQNSNSSSTTNLFGATVPTKTNKTLNFDDDDEDGYVNNMNDFPTAPLLQQRNNNNNDNNFSNNNAPPTSSLASNRRRGNDIENTNNNNNNNNNYEGGNIRGTTPLNRSDYRRSALASSLFAQPKGSDSSNVSSPFVRGEMLKASAPSMREFSPRNYSTADPGLSPIEANSSFPSRSAKKAKMRHDNQYNNNNINTNRNYIQMSGASTAKANMALISFAGDSHDDNNNMMESNEMKTDPSNSTLVPTDGPIVILPPALTKPKWPVHPVYDGSKEGSTEQKVSPTQAILNRVLQENNINTDTGNTVKARLDPADYMAKSFRVSFGLNGQVITPNKFFSRSLNRETHTIQFQKLVVSKNILYVPALKEQLQASKDERVFETKRKLRGKDTTSTKTNGGESKGEKMEEEDEEFESVTRVDEFGLPIFPKPTGPRLVSLLHRYQKCYSKHLFLKYPMDGNGSSPLATLSKDEKLWHSRNIWGLFNALWGRELDPQIEDSLKVQYFNDEWKYGGLYIAEANDNPQNDDVSIEVHRLRVGRRLALCHWLNSAIITCPSVQAYDRMFENVGGRGGLQNSTITPFSILNEMTKLNIAQATEMAMENGDLRLATLLSQSIGSQVTRDYILTQVDMWKSWGIVTDDDDGNNNNNNNNNNYIDDARQRIYLLLSGQLCENKLRLKEFHWLQAFAMHLCFNVDTKCGSNGSIRHGLVSYRNASNCDGQNGNGNDANNTAAPPHAWYETVDRIRQKQTNFTSLTIIAEDNETKDDNHNNNFNNNNNNSNYPVSNSNNNMYHNDTMFQLLQLAFEPGQSHAAALAEHCNTRGSFEHHLSWHLLTALDGLGIWQASSLNVNLRDSLIGNFVEELELAGLWHWAIYIALYLSDNVNKYETVSNLLHLHCPANEDDAFQKGENIKLKIKDRKVLIEISKTAKAKAYNEQQLKLLENKLEHSWEYVKLFLIHTIGIPEVMIDRALSQRSYYEKRQYPEMRYQFASGDWGGLHRNVINVLMPQCMLNRHWIVSGINQSNVNNVSGNRGRDLIRNDLHMDYLRNFVATLAQQSDMHLIKGWDSIGAVLAEYLDIESMIVNLRADNDLNMEGLSELFYRVVNLCTWLNRLVSNQELNRLNDSPIDDEIARLRLICIKEIAAEAKNWYIVLSKECNDIGLNVIENLEKLVRIPLTIDHRLKALRMLEATHLKIAILDETL